MLNAMDAMMAMLGSPGGWATIGLATAMMILIRRGSSGRRRRTD